MSTRERLIAAALLMLVGGVGCSSGAEGANRIDVYPVIGRVTMNGNPVANATVTFSPQADQPVAMGRTDASGNYSLTTYEADDGAAPGDYKVMVTKSAGGSKAGGAPSHDPNDPQASSADPQAMHAAARTSSGENLSSSLLPQKYASKADTDLTASVTDGDSNKIDFDLKP